MSRITFFGALLVLSSQASAADLDEAKLPPAAQIKIDFERDVRPLLDQNCLRCHGPERPRNHFRLDNLESALKGGDNGKDILPGDSGKSPLVHYVARLVPDMEMPPEGKGEPLSLDQVALLRAWIDQGAPWGATNPAAQLAFSADMTLRWIGVEGDKAKFRELEGMKEGFGGGLEHFSMSEQIGPDKKFTAEGRILFPDQDYQIKLSLEKNDLGFIRAGFEQWRKYYDDTGGYYQPFPVPSFSLGEDLHLDIGRAWVDFGLTRPGWPQMTVGYEYQYKQGNKSMLEWGQVNGANGKDIYPAAESLNEHTHIVKFDLTHDFDAWHLEDNARVEIYDSDTVRHDVKNQLTYTNRFATVPPSDGTVNVQEGATHVQGQNTVRLERQFTDWLFASAGYLYSRLDGDASFDQSTVDGSGVPTDALFWSSDEIVLSRETHSFSVSGLARPFEGLNLALGVQPEWTRQDGFGRVHFDEGDPSLLPSGFGVQTNTLQSSLETRNVAEEISARFTRIPWTVLFAEAHWAQEQIAQFESQTGDEAAFQDLAFSRNTDFSNQREDYRAGFSTSPWQTVSLSADFRNESSDSDYNNQRGLYAAPGYSAFITARSIDTDQFQTKLSLRPANWLKMALTYHRVTTEYHTTTPPVALGPPAVPANETVSPGGSILAGKYYADVYGINASFAPFRKFHVSGAFTYTDSRTRTAQNGDPSIVPYQGEVYSVLASASYLLDKSTDLLASYSYSRGAYGQDNVADGLPLGLDYTRYDITFGITRRLTSRLTSSLRYAFYQYSEPSSGGFNNYTANGVFATIGLKWP